MKSVTGQNQIKLVYMLSLSKLLSCNRLFFPFSLRLSIPAVPGHFTSPALGDGSAD